jgi:hypothetical protein
LAIFLRSGQGGSVLLAQIILPAFAAGGGRDHPAVPLHFIKEKLLTGSLYIRNFYLISANTKLKEKIPCRGN